MGKLKKNGGQTVGKGTYWNFRTEEKIVMEKEGVLPGNVSESYYRIHPLLVIALVALPSLLFLEIIPQYVSPLYEGFTERLLYANYAFLYIFYALVIITLAVLAVGSVLNAWIWVTFRWRPSTAYLAGEAGSIPAKDGTSEENHGKKADSSAE